MCRPVDLDQNASIKDPVYRNHALYRIISQQHRTLALENETNEIITEIEWSPFADGGCSRYHIPTITIIAKLSARIICAENISGNAYPNGVVVEKN